MGIKLEKSDLILVISAAFTILITVISFFLIRTLNQVDTSLASATASVEALNITVTKVVSQMEYQQKAIDSNSMQIRHQRPTAAPRKTITN